MFEQNTHFTNMEKVEFLLAVFFLSLRLSEVEPSLVLTNKLISHDKLEKHLQHLTSKYPDISRLYHIGESVKGNKLWVMEISSNPGQHEFLEPEFKYIGNMHGDETVGRHVLLNLIEYLLSEYESDPKIRTLVDKTRIHILCTMNPDGFEVARKTLDHHFKDGRDNANGVDLNRDFPDPFIKPFYGDVERQKETLLAIQWMKDYPFVLSANFHGGAVVVNYPYDNFKMSLPFNFPLNDTRAVAPDDDVFR